MRATILLFFIVLNSIVFAQKELKVISLKETKRIATNLSADNMEGRRAFTTGNEKAAAYIANEFQKIGLKPIDAEEQNEPMSSLFHKKVNLIMLLMKIAKLFLSSKIILLLFSIGI